MLPGCVLLSAKIVIRSTAGFCFGRNLSAPSHYPATQNARLMPMQRSLNEAQASKGFTIQAPWLRQLHNRHFTASRLRTWPLRPFATTALWQLKCKHGSFGGQGISIKAQELGFWFWGCKGWYRATKIDSTQVLPTLKRPTGLWWSL